MMDTNDVLFNNLRVSTTTNIVYFKNEIKDLWIPFWFLSVRLQGRHVFDKSGRRKKLPDNMIEGCIYSLGYKDLSRGYVKSKKQFKHSLNAAISTKVNIPTIKLSSTNVHICGLKDINSIEITARRIVSHINKVYENLRYLHENRDKIRRTINWFNHNCRGKTVNYEEFDPHGNVITVIDHEIIRPLGVPRDLDYIASTYVMRIMTTCIRMGVGYMAKVMFIIRKYILQELVHPIIPENYLASEDFYSKNNLANTSDEVNVYQVHDNIELDLEYIRCVMTNYNFDIFKIFNLPNHMFNMFKLYETIDKILDESEDSIFVAIYDPCIKPSMKLYSTIQDEDGCKYVHTMTIKQKGSVIYTSGHNETSSMIFSSFMDLMREIILDVSIDLSKVSPKSKRYYIL